MEQQANNGGFIKLYRNLYNSDIWKEITPERFKILITILYNVNYEDKEIKLKNGEIAIIKEGQFLTTYRSLAEKCGSGITKNHIVSGLKYFEKKGVISYKPFLKCRQGKGQDTRHAPTLITIENATFQEKNKKVVKQPQTRIDETPDKKSQNPRQEKSLESLENTTFQEGDKANPRQELTKPQTRIDEIADGLKNKRNKEIYMSTSYKKEVDAAFKDENKEVTETRIEKDDKEITEMKVDIEKEIDEVILYLNKKAKKRFTTTRTETRRYIRARLKEFEIDDLKLVIDFKVEEWGDSNLTWYNKQGKIVQARNYLQPQTLFSEKNFEIYLNQAIEQKRKEKNEGIEGTVRTPTEILDILGIGVI